MNKKLQDILDERALDFTPVEWAFIAFLVALFCGILFCVSAKAQQSNQFELNCQAAYGLGYQSNQVLMNYVEPGTSQATYAVSNIVVVPPSAIDQQINFSTMFPNINTAFVVGIQDISNPGQTIYIGTAPEIGTGYSKLILAPGGFQTSRTYGTNGVIFYVDNPSTQNSAYLKVFVIGN